MSTRSWSTAAAVILLLGGIACTGAQGPKGDTGPAGPQGATGAQGPAGQNGQDGQPGQNGQNGKDAVTTGTIAGTVTDAVSHAALSGVTVTLQDTTGTSLGVTATTDATGAYTLTAPMGTAQVAFTAQYYTSPTPTVVGVVAGKTVTINAALSQSKTGAPSVTLSLPAPGDDFGYGATTTVSATVTADPDGDSLTYTWKGATVDSSDSTKAALTFPTIDQAMAANTPDPSNTVPDLISGYNYKAGRFGILPVMSDTRGTVSASLTLDDGHGQKVTASISADAASILTGDRNVAVGTRVYMNAGHDGATTWHITSTTDSSAALDAGSCGGDLTNCRTPSFVATNIGKYTVTEGSNSIDIYVGDWAGAISGVGAAGGESVAVDSTCTDCHDDTQAHDNFTPWTGTGHAEMFAKDLDGLNSSHASPGCYACHTVGYDVGVNNHGFDDVLATSDWQFPTTLQAGNWQAMVTAAPQLARLANIQCENCHGPNGNGQSGNLTGAPAHKLTGALNSATAPNDSLTDEINSPRISFSAEVCGTCHAGATHHHNYSAWNTYQPGGKSNGAYSHSNRTPAETFGVSMKQHCGRCHTAQGYMAYQNNLVAGIPGQLYAAGANPPPANLTAANAQPVTCIVCHDAHSDAFPNQLRQYDDTDLLPSGFEVTGAGKGAVCMTCHNSRNGMQTGSETATYLHEDSESYNSGNPLDYSAPHQACQTDVFAGENAYFLGNSLPMISKHAAVEDTCVGCHMTNNPATKAEGTDASHNYWISDAEVGSLCQSCHGSAGDVDGKAIQASVETLLDQLGTKLGAAVVDAANNSANGITVTAYDDATTDATGASRTPTGDYSTTMSLAAVASGNLLASATIEEIHGQIGFELTFTNPVDNIQLVDSHGNNVGSPISLKSFGVQLGALKDGSGSPAPLFGLDGTLVRGGWNYFLIEGDQSKGIHNPTFVRDVLNSSLAQDYALPHAT